ncbi:MAG TPA: hypothetical protein VFV53_10125, partial [Candidatus Limnocylindrales bacterium]|nr:hypothetical protein [Candidatus Limnocylindrales bacterium]
MTDRTRRGITLSWLVLFVLSIMLQYGNLTNPSPVGAVHAEGFELDGNAAVSTGLDWDGVYQLEETFFSTDPIVSNDPDAPADDIFKGGGAKDIHDITAWLWTLQNPQPKDDIQDAYAYPIVTDTELLAYFGQDRTDTNGDAVVGFWFFQDAVAKTDIVSNGGFEFSGAHVAGDVLVILDYSNGGAQADSFVYKWVGTGGEEAFDTLDCIGASDPLQAPPHVVCPAITDEVMGVTNGGGAIDAAWRQDIPEHGFFEGGIDLTALGLDLGCFSSFMATSRSSTSPDSTASDFVGGQFSLCRQPDLDTTASEGSITIGDAGGVFDTAFVTDEGDPVTTGTVTFYVCGPTAEPELCDPATGTELNTDTLDANGEATSDPVSPTAPGWYCFATHYEPADGSFLLPADHSNDTTECFEVLMATPSITTAADQTVFAGTAIHDSATLSGGFNPTGSITFRAYGPNDATCAGAAVFTSAPVA